MKKRKLVIFEGISGSGKSTLEDAFRKANNYHDYTIHRFTASKYVYDTLYSRKFDLELLQKDEIKLQQNFRVKVVLCTVPPVIANRRKMLMLDTNIEPNLEKAQGLFIHYFANESKFGDWSIINTDGISIEDCTKTVINFVSLP